MAVAATRRIAVGDVRHGVSDGSPAFDGEADDPRSRRECPRRRERTRRARGSASSPDRTRRATSSHQLATAAGADHRTRSEPDDRCADPSEPGRVEPIGGTVVAVGGSTMRAAGRGRTPRRRPGRPRRPTRRRSVRGSTPAPPRERRHDIEPAAGRRRGEHPHGRWSARRLGRVDHLADLGDRAPSACAHHARRGRRCRSTVAAVDGSPPAARWVRPGAPGSRGGTARRPDCWRGRSTSIRRVPCSSPGRVPAPRRRALRRR